MGDFSDHQTITKLNDILHLLEPTKDTLNVNGNNLKKQN